MDEVIKIQKRVLEANERNASELRDHFDQQGTVVLNLISSPGSGKTTLLERTAERMASGFRLGALEGDVATERDAERLRRMGIPAHQILTGGSCHLDARQIDKALRSHTLEDLDILFIENVGNLICPTSYDLGEDFKVALLSISEGDDKPFKYPAIFSRAAVTVITKVDLLPHVTFDLPAVRQQVSTLNPEVHLFETSSSTGEGLDDWCRFLEEKVKEKRANRTRG